MMTSNVATATADADTETASLLPNISETTANRRGFAFDANDRAPGSSHRRSWDGPTGSRADVQQSKRACAVETRGRCRRWASGDRELERDGVHTLGGCYV